jgi:hypothetical protein
MAMLYYESASRTPPPRLALQLSAIGFQLSAPSAFGSRPKLIANSADR